jgi:hypothetical protein
MRVLFLLDKKIPQASFDRVWGQVREIYNGLKIETKVERMSYEKITGEMRYRFDSLPYGFVKKHVDATHKRDPNRYDHIIFLVHEDNWVYQAKRVWGENFSHYFYDYHVELCRWDKDNEANSVGTIYHEITHSHDALVERELGVRLEDVVGIADWDKDFTHGGAQEWYYIRHKENQSGIRSVKQLLADAYEKRKVRYLKGYYNKLSTVVELMKKVIDLKRRLQSKKKTSCH